MLYAFISLLVLFLIAIIIDGMKKTKTKTKTEGLIDNVLDIGTMIPFV